MTSARARIALLGLLTLGAAACEDGTGPDGSPSTFDVFVYVETGDSAGMHAGDIPVEATVTVASNFDDEVLTQTTGPDGIASFENVRAGAYTVSHVATSTPPGADLQGSAAQTVVAPFAGATVDTRFVYTFAPGSLAGVAFRDDDGSGEYEAGLDSAFAGVVVRLFEGTDTTGTPIASDTTGADGGFDLGQLDPGDYVLGIRPLVGTAVVGGTPQPVTVSAGEATFHELELVGDPTGPVVTIAAARAAAEGDTVKVRGVVTAGQGTFLVRGFYLQDATGGIAVFGVDSALGLAAGDSVQVIGRRSSASEEVQLIASSAVRLGTGLLPEPAIITAADLNAGLRQGQLASLTATIDSIGTTGAGIDYLVYVHDATDSAVILVDGDTDIAATEFTVNTEQTITGIVSVHDTDDDGTIEDGDYRLKPRDAADVP